MERVDGVLHWNADGLKEKFSNCIEFSQPSSFTSSERTISNILQKNRWTVNDADVMEETFVSRFDALDVRVWKISQSCAVLGLKFALTDVIQVQPEISEADTLWILLWTK